MSITVRTLWVLPNPWAAIDHLGRPAAAVPVDPVDHDPHNRRWVGATCEAKLVKPAQRQRIGSQIVVVAEAEYDLEWTFTDAPVRLPNTPYYRERVKRGELLAADKATAAACNVKLAKFQDPKRYLETLKGEAIKEFDARNGDGAYEALGQQRADDQKEREAVAQAAAGTVPEPTKPTAKAATASK